MINTMFSNSILIAMLSIALIIYGILDGYARRYTDHVLHIIPNEINRITSLTKNWYKQYHVPDNMLRVIVSSNLYDPFLERSKEILSDTDMIKVLIADKPKFMDLIKFMITVEINNPKYYFGNNIDNIDQPIYFMQRITRIITFISIYMSIIYIYYILLSAKHNHILIPVILSSIIYVLWQIVKCSTYNSLNNLCPKICHSIYTIILTMTYYNYINIIAPHIIYGKEAITMSTFIDYNFLVLLHTTIIILILNIIWILFLIARRREIINTVLHKFQNHERAIKDIISSIINEACSMYCNNNMLYHNDTCNYCKIYMSDTDLLNNP